MAGGRLVRRHDALLQLPDPSDDAGHFRHRSRRLRRAHLPVQLILLLYLFVLVIELVLDVVLELVFELVVELVVELVLELVLSDKHDLNPAYPLADVQLVGFDAHAHERRVFDPHDLFFLRHLLDAGVDDDGNVLIDGYVSFFIPFNLVDACDADIRCGRRNDRRRRQRVPSSAAHLKKR